MSISVWNYRHGIVENVAEVVEESTLPRTQVLEWCTVFRQGREVIRNLSHARRPSNSANDDNVEKSKGRALENRLLASEI